LSKGGSELEEKRRRTNGLQLPREQKDETLRWKEIL